MTPSDERVILRLLLMAMGFAGLAYVLYCILSQ